MFWDCKYKGEKIFLGLKHPVMASLKVHNFRKRAFGVEVRVLVVFFVLLDSSFQP